MSIKSTAHRKDLAVEGRTRLPGTEFPHAAVKKKGHGVMFSTRVRPPRKGGRPLSKRSAQHKAAFVEVRLDSMQGSAAAHELLAMSVSATLDWIVKVQQKQSLEGALASVKKVMAETTGSAASSAQYFAELRRVLEFSTAPTTATAQPGPKEAPRAEAHLPQANRAALERAFARAEVNKVEILKRPDMLRGEEIGERLNLSRAGVDQRRIGNRLLALELGSKRGVRYPAWQGELVEDAGTRVAFESVLSALAKVGPWSRYRFFVQPAPALGGRTPIDALKAGEHESVRDAAESWARGDQGGH